jgi:DNA (cytosine-5)-methyltransferase 1
MLRIIQEVRPGWVVGENVAGIIDLGLDDVLSSLENIGYSTQAFDTPACAVELTTMERHVWIVAASSSIRCKGSEKITYKNNGNEGELPRTNQGIEGRWYLPESRVCRVRQGIPNQMDRIRSLGNAIPPQQVYPILKAIADIENS